jgi:hypothetical protein
MLKIILSSKLGTFLLVAIAYGVIYFLNDILTEFLYLVPGAHLFHIPSGLKFLFVLIAGWVGALGVGVATFVGTVLYKFPDQWILGTQLALINGLAPLLVRKLFIENLGLKDDLSNIHTKQIILMGLLFVFLNSSLNQLILLWNNMGSNFLDGMLVMLVGDLTGTYFVLSVMKVLTRKILHSEESKHKEL